MSVTFSIKGKISHFKETKELALFTPLELAFLFLDKRLEPIKEEGGEYFQKIDSQSKKYLGEDWYTDFLAESTACSKCRVKYKKENMNFCDSGEHYLCPKCSCSDEYQEDTKSYRFLNCYCGGVLV